MLGKFVGKFVSSFVMVRVLKFVVPRIDRYLQQKKRAS